MRELTAAGRIEAVDRAVLAAYCAVWGRHVWAEQQLSQMLPIVRASEGKIAVSPLVRLSHLSAELLRKLAIDLGITPRIRNLHRDARPETPPEEDSANLLRQFKVVG